jgi:type IV secretory pathway VirB2 component (pilin)
MAMFGREKRHPRRHQTKTNKVSTHADTATALTTTPAVGANSCRRRPADQLLRQMANALRGELARTLLALIVFVTRFVCRVITLAAARWSARRRQTPGETSAL